MPAPSAPFIALGSIQRMRRPMVEQRNSRLERDRHRGAIDLGQNVIGKVGQCVEILHALHEIWHQFLDAPIVERALGLSTAFHRVLGSTHWLTIWR